MIFHRHLEAILLMANKESWVGIVPYVGMRLKLAISVLNRHHPKFWEMNPVELEQVLKQYPRIEAQFKTYDEVIVGFAIRTLRMQPKLEALVAT